MLSFSFNLNPYPGAIFVRNILFPFLMVEIYFKKIDLLIHWLYEIFRSSEHVKQHMEISIFCSIYF